MKFETEYEIGEKVYFIQEKYIKDKCCPHCGSNIGYKVKYEIQKCKIYSFGYDTETNKLNYFGKYMDGYEKYVGSYDRTIHGYFKTKDQAKEYITKLKIDSKDKL